MTGLHGFTPSDGWLLDRLGRHTLLRGVNLGGNVKRPALGDGEDVSFVGHPLPLAEADLHLRRLRHWGFNLLRLLVSWEAIEHAGPGRHDQAYLDYVRALVQAARRHDLWVFLDPHQDVWSRWTGGDGAPRWCFDLAGLLPERFAPAQAVELDALDWVANYQRVPVATMWTLFFGGDVFLPELHGVQATLQDHYIAAVAALAERVADLDNVLGYDTLNEPSYGYIARTAAELHLGVRTMGEGPPPFSPLQHLAAADGVPVRRPAWHRPGAAPVSGEEVLNPAGLSIWRGGCPFRRAGVWDLDGEGRPVLLRPDYFSHRDGQPVRPFGDFVVPFIRRLRAAVRRVHPGCLLFIEGAPNDFHTPWDDDDALVVNARHWYDFVALTRRRFDPEDYQPIEGYSLRGVPAIAEFFAGQLQGIAAFSRESMRNAPVLIGEFGIPYDLNGGAAYRTGDYSAQTALLDANYRALEHALLGSAQWTYTRDSTHAGGDGWNHEDLSIYSPDDAGPAGPGADDLDRGGRGVDAFSRPYVRHAAGRPLRMRFDLPSRRFELALWADPAVAAPTEVFVPRRHYPDGPRVEVSSGRFAHDPERQLLRWHHPGASGEITLRLSP